MKGVKKMQRAVCCKCRTMQTTNEMDQVVGCLGSFVWLCKGCSLEHHKQQIKEILIDAQDSGLDISKWSYLLD